MPITGYGIKKCFGGDIAVQSSKFPHTNANKKNGQNGILAIFSTSVCVGKFWTLQTYISTKTLFYPISCDGHINWVLKSKKLHEPREESATSARWPASQKNQFLGNSLNPNIIHDPPRGQRNSLWNFWHGHTLETLNTHREHGFLQCWSWVANKCV